MNVGNLNQGNRSGGGEKWTDTGKTELSEFGVGSSGSGGKGWCKEQCVDTDRFLA